MAQTTSELEESLLIRLLTTSPDRRLTDSERKAFDAAHEDYIDALQALSQDLRKSPPAATIFAIELRFAPTPGYAD